MSIIAGVTVDFSLSPRIITIPIPIVTVSIQDVHDTVVSIEDDLVAGLEFARLISSGGKEDLGGGAAVGVTATLQNARLAFASRPGPSFVQCVVTGGNLVAVDSDGDAISVIETTDFTQVVIAQSSSPTSAEATGGLTLAKFIALR